MTIPFETDVKTLTEEQLEEFHMQLLRRQDDIYHERNRRQALPFIWESEVITVKSIRAALGKPEYLGEDGDIAPWTQPTNPMNAHIADDRVNHNGKDWIAVGRGTIYTEPGVEDPIQGAVWNDLSTYSEDEIPGA